MKERSKISHEISFRAFHEEDFPEIKSLWDICDMGGKERGDSVKTISDCNKQGGSFIVVELAQTKQIIGTSWMTWDGRRIFLHHFCIHPDYRGRGFGELLGRESLKFIKKKDAQVKLEVHKKNIAAKKLYDKLGFFAFEDYDIYMIRDLKKNEE